MPSNNKTDIDVKHANLRDVDSVLLVWVLEGKGTTEDVYEQVGYVVTKDGSILGKLDQDWMFRKPRLLTPNK